MSAPKVLVVEDESLVALDICKSIKRFGYEPLGPVATGEQAIEVAKSERPDLVLMDIVLAGAADGVSAAAQIADALDIPTVFLTAHADVSTLERAKLTQPAGYVLKPFDESQLRVTIEMALHRRDHAREQLAKLPAHANGNGKRVIGKVDGDQRPQWKQFLSSLDFFAELEESELDLLCNAISLKILRQGETLPLLNDSEASPFIVRNGRIAMIQNSPVGKELIVEFVQPGDIFGLISAIEPVRGPLSARAVKQTEILVIPKRTFLLLMESHPRLVLRFAEYISGRLRDAQQLARALAYEDVPARVMFVLDALSSQLGFREPSNGLLRLDLSRQDLARLTGTSPETIVRALKALERVGLVGLDQRKTIAIPDPDRLKAHCRSAEQGIALPG